MLVQLTLCTGCHKPVPSAPGFCVLCGQHFGETLHVATFPSKAKVQAPQRQLDQPHIKALLAA